MKYVTTAVTDFPAGVRLGLSEAQAAARKHALKSAGGKGWFETTQAIEFKVGETIVLAGEPAKHQLQHLQAMSAPRTQQGNKD